MKLFASALVLAAAIAAPAMAGPAGTGLGHTEEVARRHNEARTVKIADLGGCAERAASAVRSHDGVARASHAGGHVTVTFHSPDHVARHAAGVRAAANTACAVG